LIEILITLISLKGIHLFIVFVLGNKMHSLNNEKKNNLIVKAEAILVMVASVVFATATMAPSALGSISEDGFTLPTANLRSEPKLQWQYLKREITCT
jgi:hypothetical protein